MTFQRTLILGALLLSFAGYGCPAASSTNTVQPETHGGEVSGREGNLPAQNSASWFGGGSAAMKSAKYSAYARFLPYPEADSKGLSQITGDRIQ